jgi:hypothetical protein
MHTQSQPQRTTLPSADLVPTQPGQRRLETYRPACATDLRVTFARARLELAKRQAGGAA